MKGETTAVEVICVGAGTIVVGVNCGGLGVVAGGVVCGRGARGVAAGTAGVVETDKFLIFGVYTPYCSIRCDNAPRSCCIFAEGKK